MKVAISYPFIAGEFNGNKSDLKHLYGNDRSMDRHKSYADNFVKTYKKFSPGVEHELNIVFTNGPVTDTALSVFRGIKCDMHTYTGGGWDIGCDQFMSSRIKADFVVFMNSSVYSWRAGWLKRLVDARLKHGEGLYGIYASFESNPLGDGRFRHIRSSCFACNPAVFNKYPYKVDSREKSMRFESGIWSYSKWFMDNRLACKLVTWDNEYDMPNWRVPANGFRRGDQSDCLLMDRHSTLYKGAAAATKVNLAKYADGLI